MNNLMNNLFIIDNELDKDNIEKMNSDIKYLLDVKTKLELLDYDLTPIEMLNEGDNIILLKKTTLRIYKIAKFSHHDDKFLYLNKNNKNNKNNSKIKSPREYKDLFYIFYKHVHTTKNMMQYLLNALENDTLDIK
jgi:hypothetical protein